MEANCKNLELFKGATKTLEIIVTENGVAFDITNWTIYFTVKKYLTDTDENAEIHKEISDHEEATSGKTLINLSTEDTDIEPREYYYTVDFKDTEGNEGVILYGKLLVKRAVIQNRD